MKMTNSELSNRLALLKSLGKATGDWGYAIARNSRKMKEEGKEYFEMAAEVFNKYAVPDENDPDKKTVPTEIWEREMGSVSVKEVEVDICTVSKDVFVQQGLTAIDMEKLLWMVEED